jgi:hypothetical protein
MLTLKETLMERRTVVSNMIERNNSTELPEVRVSLVSDHRSRGATLLLMPIPLGERRSSGVSAPHSIYLDESHLLVNVTVTAVKEGCTLGLVLEHLDETGAPIAAENVATYVAPRTHQRIAAVKGCMVRIKWILTGERPSSTFGVITEGISSNSMATTKDGAGEDPNFTQSFGVDLTTFQGLRDYLSCMTPEANGAGLNRSAAL